MMRVLPALMLLLLVTGTGCDDTVVDPFDNPGRYFSVWGWIDPGATRQVVRVVPVTRWPPVVQNEGDLNATIDARVFSVDLNRGSEIEWSHRLQRLEDGSLAHIFLGDLDVRPSARFRLEVRRSDGRTAIVETRVPGLGFVEGVSLGEPYEGPGGHLFQDVTLEGISNPWDILLTYAIDGLFTGGSDPDVSRTAWIDYGRSGHRNASGDWVFTANLTADQAVLRAAVEEGIRTGEIPGPNEAGEDFPFSLVQMGVRLTVLDDAWPIPGDSVDVEQYARPGGVTNVVNGYGFWGAAVPYIEQWPVQTELSLRLGWDF